MLLVSYRVHTDRLVCWGRTGLWRPDVNVLVVQLTLHARSGPEHLQPCSLHTHTCAF